jgi:hypothetical protein
MPHGRAHPLAWLHTHSGCASTARSLSHHVPVLRAAGGRLAEAGVASEAQRSCRWALSCSAIVQIWAHDNLTSRPCSGRRPPGCNCCRCSAGTDLGATASRGGRRRRTCRQHVLLGRNGRVWGVVYTLLSVPVATANPNHSHKCHLVCGLRSDTTLAAPKQRAGHSNTWLRERKDDTNTHLTRLAKGKQVPAFGVAKGWWAGCALRRRGAQRSPLSKPLGTSAPAGQVPASTRGPSTDPVNPPQAHDGCGCSPPQHNATGQQVRRTTLSRSRSSNLIG